MILPATRMWTHTLGMGEAQPDRVADVHVDLAAAVRVCRHVPHHTLSSRPRP